MIPPVSRDQRLQLSFGRLRLRLFAIAGRLVQGCRCLRLRLAG